MCLRRNLKITLAFPIYQKHANLFIYLFVYLSVPSCAAHANALNPSGCDFCFKAILRDSVVSVEIEVKPHNLVPDTNCFIDYLSQLQIIARAGTAPQHYYTLMVPLVGKCRVCFIDSAGYDFFAKTMISACEPAKCLNIYSFVYYVYNVSNVSIMSVCPSVRMFLSRHDESSQWRGRFLDQLGD